MSNLDNLIKRILDDAKKRASIIIEDAIRIKEEIIDIRIKEANENRKKIVEKANLEASLLKARVISGAELRARNEKLKAKQNVIERVFKLAKERLRDLDEDKYVEYLTEVVENLQLNGGEILVVPEKMRDKVKDLNLPFKISEDEVVDSGFLVKDKGIILNYTFDSLVDYYKEDLETEVAKNIFKEEE